MSLSKIAQCQDAPPVLCEAAPYTNSPLGCDRADSPWKCPQASSSKFRDPSPKQIPGIAAQFQEENLEVFVPARDVSGVYL